MSLIDGFFDWIMQPLKILASFDFCKYSEKRACGSWLSPSSHGYLEVLAAIKVAGDDPNWKKYVEEWGYFYKLEPSFHGLCGVKKKIVKLQTVRVDFIGIDGDYKEVHDLRRLYVPANYKRVE